MEHKNRSENPPAAGAEDPKTEKFPFPEEAASITDELTAFLKEISAKKERYGIKEPKSVSEDSDGKPPAGRFIPGVYGRTKD